MILTDEQRKEIFDEGKKAAEIGRSMRSCPYLRDGGSAPARSTLSQTVSLKAHLPREDLCASEAQLGNRPTTPPGTVLREAKGIT